MIKAIEYNNNKYKTDIEFDPHYIYEGDAKVLKKRGNKRYYDVCFWFSSGIFGWQVIEDNGQYYVGAPGITEYILYEGELNVLDIVKFLIKEYGSNSKICLEPALFNLLKQQLGNK